MALESVMTPELMLGAEESVMSPLVSEVGVRATLSAPEVVTMATCEDVSLPITIRSRLTVFAPITRLVASSRSPLVVAAYGNWTNASLMAHHILASVMRITSDRLAINRRIATMPPVLVTLEVFTQPLSA